MKIIIFRVVHDFSLNIMLRVFSTPAHESSQFILKLQFSDPLPCTGKIVVVIGTPPYRNSNEKIDLIPRNLILPSIISWRHDAQEFPKSQNREIHDFQKKIDVFGRRLG